MPAALIIKCQEFQACALPIMLPISFPASKNIQFNTAGSLMPAVLFLIFHVILSFQHRLIFNLMQ